jgi:hypothetical protein
MRRHIVTVALASEDYHPEEEVFLDVVEFTGSPQYISAKHLLVEEGNWYDARDTVAYHDDPEIAETLPIQIVRAGEWYYLLDGHHRVNVAIRDGLPLEAIIVQDRNSWLELSQTLRNFISDWAFVEIPDPNQLTIHIVEIPIKEVTQCTNLSVVG